MSRAAIWHLSDEALVHIFSFLSAQDIGQVGGVCRRWAQVAEDRHVWRGKSFLAEGFSGLMDACPVAKTLPVLKNVSVYKRGHDARIYLNEESVLIEVPYLLGRPTSSVIMTLVMESLTFDLPLADSSLRNCLLVQLHKLKKLQVAADAKTIDYSDVVTKLRAFAGTLASEPLPDLQAVDISIGVLCGDYIDTETLAALATCPALERLSLSTPYFLSWHADAKFPKLQILKLQHCALTDMSFLGLCPNLRSLSLNRCKLLKMRKLSFRSELRHLELHNLPIDAEFLNTLCGSCPELESIVIKHCKYSQPALHLKHCSRLLSFEMDLSAMPPWKLPYVTGLPSKLRQLWLSWPEVKSEQLAEIVTTLPHLEVLGVTLCGCRPFSLLHHFTGLSEVSADEVDHNMLENLYGTRNLRSSPFSFLRHCTGLTALTELSVKQADYNMFEHVIEVAGLRGSPLSFIHHWPGLIEMSLDEVDYNIYEQFIEGNGLRNLRKLSVHYDDHDVAPLADTLQKMPQLEALKVKFQKIVPDLSFLRQCDQLRSLTLECDEIPHERPLWTLGYSLFSIKVLESVLANMPHLEELDVGVKDRVCDFSFLRNCRHITTVRISFLHLDFCDFQELRCLEQLRRLTLTNLAKGPLSNRHLPLLEEEVLRMPQLEYLALERDGPNVLESWDWRKALSSLSSKD